MGVDVIVCNYRTPRDLEEFLVSYEQPDDHELWVCDVDPLDDFKPEMQRFMPMFSRANYIPFFTNVGYATAVNRAAQRGNHDIIAIFNADVVLTPGAVERCADALTTREDWGILGPLQINQRKLGVHTGIFGTLKNPQWRSFNRFVRNEWRDVRDDAVTVMGSAYFVKRSLWDELTNCPIYQSLYPDAEGAFLPTQHYYEETWCSYHAQAHGKKVVYFGECEVIHKWHQASPQGGAVDNLFPVSRELFRAACDAHGIDHD